MKLHWSPRSPFVRKVMMLAHEHGIAERIELVRSVAMMLEPNAQIMRDNPLNKIPTLVLDDGSSLFDSVVICEYLDELAVRELGRTTLFPAADGKWSALRWHALANGWLDQLILWRNERDRIDGTRSDKLIMVFEFKTRAVLQQLEAELPAIRKAPLNIGTLTLACALGYLDFRFDQLAWRSDAPQLAIWFAGMQARPSFRATEAAL
jgi:glutathione S-transferase